MEFGIGRSFFRGPEALGSWGFDEESPFEQIRVLDPAPDPRAIRHLLGCFQRLYPALKDVTVDQAWGSYIDSTPDAVPVISPVDPIKGFVLAAGFSGHGFGTGPGTGQLAREPGHRRAATRRSHALPLLALWRRLEGHRRCHLNSLHSTKDHLS